MLIIPSAHQPRELSSVSHAASARWDHLPSCSRRWYICAYIICIYSDVCANIFTTNALYLFVLFYCDFADGVSLLCGLIEQPTAGLVYLLGRIAYVIGYSTVSVHVPLYS